MFKKNCNRFLAGLLAVVTIMTNLATPMTAYANTTATTYVEEVTAAVDASQEVQDDATDSGQEESSEADESDSGLSFVTISTDEELSLEGAIELTEEEFDAMIEESENQVTVDEDTGLTLVEVLEAAVEEGIAIAELNADETVSYTISIEAANDVATISDDEEEEEETATTETVSITRGSWYYYSDYDLGTYKTAPYYVSYGSITATAYCVQPSKPGPDDGTYTVTKLSDGKELAKVIYYATDASGDLNFFEVNYPDYSTGKRFIITHLAAAYANGSSDAFKGANSTGQALAMELYEYAVGQPDIPDAAMSLSKSSVTAYVDGTTQRTEEITFSADELQTITLDLPSGVVFHNVTTGETSSAGDSVTISGGTTFYLSAPLTQAADVSATWSTTAQGSITKEYSAYKITTTSSTQDLAFVFGEGVESTAKVSLTVNWLQQATIQVIKSDATNGVNLSGAVFGIYSDAACTTLIATMDATDANGASEITLTKTQEVVYLKEITAPVGYQLNTTAYNVTLVYGGTTTVTVTDEQVTAHITLIKRDAETGTAQGDATLEGAVYGLYAREDIVHPGNGKVLYSAGELITTLTTDANGEAEIADLYLGSYYIQEITAPVGYVLDTTEYDLTLDEQGELVATVENTCIVTDTVIKQPFQIIKAVSNGKTDADLLEGAGFTVYLLSSLTVNEDGSYDFDSATPVVITEDGSTEMFTDKNGYACSIALPYGTYLVRETTTPENYSPVDDFIVTISENNPDTPQVWRVLLDEEFSAKLKIIKQDDQTKQTILKANTEFKVYDLDNACYVEQITTYPKTTVHTSYCTDDEGYLILPEALSPGNYRIEEVTAPDAYTLNTEYVTVSVSANAAYLMDSVSGDAIIEVVYTDTSVKAELTIIKTGEQLVSYDGNFVYAVGSLEGATFAVYAAEDIYTADNQGNLIYTQGDLVATVTTDANGEAVISDLPLGKYEVVEVSAPYGYALNSNSQTVEFTYADQYTPVVCETLTFNNERQKVEISVEKQNSLNNATVAGAVFGIYNAEDITVDGEVIVPADTLLQEITTDENGLATCTLDLPLGSYYVKELQSPAGFASSDEVLAFDASYQGQEVETIYLTAVFQNDPTTVEITKADLTTGVELDGAYLYVYDSEGNLIDSWVSVADQPHVIRYLVVGETYTLHEEIAPYGYLVASDVTFTIADTGEVQQVTMYDEVPTATLMINKQGEFLESVTLIDLLSGLLEHIFHYITGNLADVTFEIYAAEDIKAADGVSEDYYKADDLVATVTTDAVGIATLEGLPVGKYYVKEVATASGYVLDAEVRYIDLSYIDQDTPIVLYSQDWQNNRQTMEVSVFKTDSEGNALEGAVFGLYAAEDILSASGSVLIEAGQAIEVKVTDANGKLTFVADLPLGYSYYVQEVLAPDGYVTSDEVLEFAVTYAGEDVEVQYLELSFENEMTTVEISKTDLTTGEELPGATLQVTDDEGNIVDEWISTDEPHIITGLTVGKSYTLTETIPAAGYVTAESIVFTIENTADVQRIEMQDDVTKVLISKQDIGGNELPGATLIIYDAEGNVVDTWISSDEAHYIEMLPIGTYTLHEEAAPDGYQIASDIEFEVLDTGEVQTVIMVDEAEIDTPKTGDDSNILLWVVLLVISLGGIGGCGIYAIRRKKFD